jgi:hypothetical protein
MTMYVCMYDDGNDDDDNSNNNHQHNNDDFVPLRIIVRYMERL